MMNGCLYTLGPSHSSSTILHTNDKTVSAARPLAAIYYYVLLQCTYACRYHPVEFWLRSVIFNKSDYDSVRLRNYNNNNQYENTLYAVYTYLRIDIGILTYSQGRRGEGRKVVFPLQVPCAHKGACCLQQVCSEFFFINNNKVISPN